MLAKRLLLILVLVSLSNLLSFPAAYAVQQPEKKPSEHGWVERTLDSMTLDEKIGQLIIPAKVGMFLARDSETFQQMRRDIIEFHVGGYHLLGETNALHEPAGVALLINHLQALAKAPLWITADFEGGVGLRFIGATGLPRAMAVGATGNPEMAYQAG